MKCPLPSHVVWSLAVKAGHVRKGKAGCPWTPASSLGETTRVISVCFVFNFHKAFICDSFLSNTVLWSFWKKKKRSTSSFHLLPGNSKICIILLCISLEEELELWSLNYRFLTAFPLFLHSLTSLRKLITETCSRVSIVARLTSQNGLGQKWLLLCQESHAASFPLETLYLICLHLFLAFWSLECLFTWLQKWFQGLSWPQLIQGEANLGLLLEFWERDGFFFLPVFGRISWESLQEWGQHRGKQS